MGFRRLCGGCDGDGVAEFFEFADEGVFAAFGIPPAAGVPVSAEVLIDGVVRDDVPVGEENIVPGRADGFEESAPGASLSVVGSAVHVFAAAAYLRGLAQHGACRPILVSAVGVQSLAS